MPVDRHQTTVKIEARSGTFDVHAPAGESILFAGLAQGVGLPYECATGTCGTCRARVMHGAVDVVWDAAPGHAKLKREKGDILMCQTRASGDCVLRVPSDVAVSSKPPPARFHATVVDVVPLTHDVTHFEVELDRPMAFEAGQFVVLSAAGISGGRAYSMVNYAPSSRRLSFVIKRKPDGRFSDWLFGADRLGAAVEVFGALGKATFQPHEAHNLVILAGGSGIAGMMSILDRATSAGHFQTHRGHVYFGVRTLADGFYLDRIAGFVAEAHGALAATLVLSHAVPAQDHHPDYPGIRLDTGFVHEAAARGLDGGVDNALAFVAGPPAMVDGATRVLLTAARVPARQIRYDKFG